MMIVVLSLAAGCIHGWVGRSVVQLEREMGRPRNIQRTGDFRVYVYPDPLAPGQQMRFVIDDKGVIRQWTASATVPGVFETTIGGDDPFNPNSNAPLNFPASTTNPFDSRR